MSRESIIKKRYAGILATVLFAVWVLISEFCPVIIGGDIGSFLYVTFHFILNPLIGIIILAYAVWHSYRTDKVFVKFADIIACTFPVFIIYTGFTGSLWLTEVLGITFR